MKHRSLFTTIRTEGGLLPPGLLQQVASGDSDLDGLRSEDYHLGVGERLNEAISRSWNRLRSAWTGFRNMTATVPEDDPGTSLTRERWLLILFQELAYGRLSTSKAIEIEGKSYPISHFRENVPFHLVGFHVDLDKRTAGVAGAARTSPHSLVQEFLNRSEDHLWGFLANGLRLRILRDNVSLTRQAYVEFDLVGMMDGEVYSDFVLLWLLCHQSRVEGEKPDTFWLERWAQVAQEQGVRALDSLRDSVQKAISHLGTGFLQHLANHELRDRLQSGQLNKQDYYRQLLRLVYRLIFLFVAEDRDLLLDPNASERVRERYKLYYSTSRLRQIAQGLRGTRHCDMFRGLTLVMKKLGSDEGCPELGLPALGSFLWSEDTISDIAQCDISNYDVLEAIRSLAFTIEERIFRGIDFKNLGAEELGSIYEALLELHPELNTNAGTFSLTTAVGHERKTTGSYYTPKSLVQCLLDSALDPVISAAADKPTQQEAEQAILDLKICDSASGSGHFVIAAAHRVAKKLAAVRTGDEEPSPDALHHALRDVISHCIYAVDINPMAVELCKVSLWLEALEPGKPLSFLDHHIKCGNSLLGTTPALLAKGIPDEALKPIEGDDKEVCKALKKQNKEERKGQKFMFVDLVGEKGVSYGSLAASFGKLDDIPDDTIKDLHQKEVRFRALAKSKAYKKQLLIADAWCAAFVGTKTKDASLPITHGVFLQLAGDPSAVPKKMIDEITRLRKQYQFFHWHLAFPEVFRIPDEDKEAVIEQTGWSNGFDVVLGNPPWERIKLQEKEFFATRNPEIANAPNATVRRRMIARLPETDPALFQAFEEALRRADGESHLIRDTGRYPLCSRGDVNTYSIFAELKRSLLNSSGCGGYIVPSGIATDDTNKLFFQELVDSQALISFYDFDNKDALFPAVHRAYKFCLLTLGAPRSASTAKYAFFLSSTDPVHDSTVAIELSSEDIHRLNPNTKTCPIFRSPRDAQITLAVHRRMSVLVNESLPENEGNPWRLTIRRVFDMNRQDSLAACMSLDRFGELSDPVIMYESKLITQYNHRFNTYKGSSPVSVNADQLNDSFYTVVPRYVLERSKVASKVERLWNHDWLLVWRDVTDNKTVARTANACIVPFAGTDFTLRVGFIDHSVDSIAAFVALMNSFVVDYLIRQSIGGLHLSDYITKQTAWPTPEALTTWTDGRGSLGSRFIVERTIELLYTTWDLSSFACECGYDGPPFRWDEERRFLIRCELDAALFHLYDISRDDVQYILGTFPIVQRREEQVHGHYRTKDTILKIYDEMARISAENATAGAAGRQPSVRYQTCLNLPPGPPCDAQGNFIPMVQWDHANWPSHIHQPKEAVIERPEEVPIGDLAAMAYPASDTDSAICAAALAIIEQSGELSSMDHLDALLLTTHPDWCKIFLEQKSHSAFDKAVGVADKCLFVDKDQSIHWKECRGYLEKRNAIAVSHRDRGQPIAVGADISSVKASLSLGVDDVVKLALKALEQVGKLRKDLAALPQGQQDILRFLEVQHREYQLA